MDFLSSIGDFLGTFLRDLLIQPIVSCQPAAPVNTPADDKISDSGKGTCYEVYVELAVNFPNMHDDALALKNKCEMFCADPSSYNKELCGCFKQSYLNPSDYTKCLEENKPK